MNEISIGDAVIPRDEPDHDVMTVYDLKNNYNEADCNWVIGTTMFKRRIAIRELIRLERKPRKAA
jgi:hypothetical protein